MRPRGGGRGGGRPSQTYVLPGRWRSTAGRESATAAWPLDGESQGSWREEGRPCSERGPIRPGQAPPWERSAAIPARRVLSPGSGRAVLCLDAVRRPFIPMPSPWAPIQKEGVRATRGTGRNGSGSSSWGNPRAIPGEAPGLAVFFILASWPGQTKRDSDKRFSATAGSLLSTWTRRALQKWGVAESLP